MAEKIPYLAQRTKSPGRERRPGSIEDSRIRAVVEAARRVGAASLKMGLPANALNTQMRRAHELLSRNDNRFVGGERQNGSTVGLKRSLSHLRNDYKDTSHPAKDWLRHLQGRLKALNSPMTLTPGTSDDSKALLKSSNAKTRSDVGQLSLGPTLDRGRRIEAMFPSEPPSFERATTSVQGPAAAKATPESFNRQRGANRPSRSFDSVRIKPSLTRVIHQFGEMKRGLDLKAGTLRPVSGNKSSIMARTADGTGLVARRSIQAGFQSEASNRAGFATATRRSERLSISGIGRNFSGHRDGRVAPNVNYAPRLFSRSLQRSTSAANSLAHQREQDSGSRVRAKLATNRSGPGSARQVTSNQPAQPIVVNFSPTIVLQNCEEFAGIENAVVQAIRQHSHELVRIIGRELQTQRRAAF
jgi:hypothetical protein